jgi:hypothetical protein
VCIFIANLLNICFSFVANVKIFVEKRSFDKDKALYSLNFMVMALSAKKKCFFFNKRLGLYRIVTPQKAKRKISNKAAGCKRSLVALAKKRPWWVVPYVVRDIKTLFLKLFYGRRYKEDGLKVPFLKFERLNVGLLAFFDLLLNFRRLNDHKASCHFDWLGKSNKYSSMERSYEEGFFSSRYKIISTLFRRQILKHIKSIDAIKEYKSFRKRHLIQKNSYISFMSFSPLRYKFLVGRFALAKASFLNLFFALKAKWFFCSFCSSIFFFFHFF